MIVQESQRILGSARNDDCIKKIPFRLFIISIDSEVAFSTEIFIEMLAAYEERIVVLIYMLSLIERILHYIRLQDIVILFKAQDSCTVHLIDFAVHYDRPEPVYLFSGHINQRWLDKEALVCSEYMLWNSELGL